MSKGDVTLFGNVTLNVEMIVHKDSMIESVRASLFLECSISFALSDICILSFFVEYFPAFKSLVNSHSHKQSVGN